MTNNKEKQAGRPCEKPVAAVLIPTEEPERAIFRSAAPQLEFHFAELEDAGIPSEPHWDVTAFSDERVSLDVSAAFLEAAEVIVGTPEPELLSSCPNLRLLQTSSAGVNTYVGQGVLPQGVRLAGCGGAYGLAVSEHMLGMLFELFKNLHLYRDLQNKQEWRDLGTARSVQDARVLVVGMGDIGSNFAAKASALGARVCAVKRNPVLSAQDAAFVEAVYPMSRLDELLPEMDVVALSLPDTAQTRGLFHRERLMKMKKGSVLLNGGRGSAVDLDGLLEAVQCGRLLGAGLDVTSPEPLPPEHPAWREPRIVITPHISGLYHLRQTYDRVVAICAENLRRYLAGEPLRNEMAPLTGERI